LAARFARHRSRWIASTSRNGALAANSACRIAFGNSNARRTPERVRAGFKRDRGNASRLATDPEIQDRVQQITTVGAERAAVTVESLINETEQARRGAMEAGQYAAAVTRFWTILDSIYARARTLLGAGRERPI
jgi:hypothetical protein